MKKKMLIGCILFFSLLFSGCAYVDVRTPYDKNLDQTQLGSKVGYSYIYSLCWLFAWGDGSYSAAAREGSITIMRHADQRIESYLFGLLGRRTTIVYGD